MVDEPTQQPNEKPEEKKEEPTPTEPENPNPSVPPEPSTPSTQEAPIETPPPPAEQPKVPEPQPENPPQQPQSPESPKTEVKPPEKKPVEEPSQSPKPPELEIKLVDIEKKIQERLKLEQDERRKLANEARAKKKEDNINRILEFSKDKKIFSNDDIRDLLHVSQSTATNYLSELTRRGSIKREGKRGGAKYSA